MLVITNKTKLEKAHGNWREATRHSLRSPEDKREWEETDTKLRDAVNAGDVDGMLEVAMGINRRAVLLECTECDQPAPRLMMFGGSGGVELCKDCLKEAIEELGDSAVADVTRSAANEPS